jgi:sucrose phosphorylase
MNDLIERLAIEIYGEAIGPAFARRIAALMAVREGALRSAGALRQRGERRFTERDALLITYGDMLSSAEVDAGTPLARLRRFLQRRAAGLFSLVHILPFYPSSSDDGFSVMDHRLVDPRLGTWEDIERLAPTFKGAFDLVLNHGSVQGAAFKAFLAREAGFERWFLTRPESYDSSSVFRPRTHPLLTPFKRSDGSIVHVWTTFSADQADYDFSNPDVLLEFIVILLDYAGYGARLVRLDAIAYLWKEDGTSCLSHPKTHAVVKLLRSVVDALSLDVAILTETNVPHEENVSYFGAGDEAHLVYNFALPPLVLHAAVSADAGPLRRWAATLGAPKSAPDQGEKGQGAPDAGDRPTGDRVFLNFLASHDGIGVTPVRGLVAEADFAATMATVEARGGLVSYKSTPSGPVPYELNCSYLDAVAPPGGDETRSRAFLCAQAVMLALAGIPAVYFHSWVGSGNWSEGVRKLGYKRAINRERLDEQELEAALDDPSSLRGKIHSGLRRLLEFRASRPAFSPYAPQRILDAEGAVFALLRGGSPSSRPVLCAQNLGERKAPLVIPHELRPGRLEVERIELRPWETRWIEFDDLGVHAELSL